MSEIPRSEQIPDDILLRELEPLGEELFRQHEKRSRPWYPHLLVPYEIGRSYTTDSWQESDSFVPPEVASALFVNLLTEDNLPYYYRDINRMFGAAPVWEAWNRRWTAEEGRHSPVIRDYLHVTRAIDPVALEDGRMAQVSRGEVPEPATAVHGFVYVTLQELATRVTHLNTGKRIAETLKGSAELSGEQKIAAAAGEVIMKRVGIDENNHYLLYRDASSAVRDIMPSRFMSIVSDTVQHFDMPGTGIPDYGTHARRIARVGIYGFTEYVQDVVEPVLDKHWKVWDMEGLTPEAEQKRDELARYLDRIKHSAIKREARAREEYQQSLAA